MEIKFVVCPGCGAPRKFRWEQAKNEFLVVGCLLKNDACEIDTLSWTGHRGSVLTLIAYEG